MNEMSLPLLSIITYIPAAGAILMALFVSGKNAAAIRNTALGIALVDFAASLVLLFKFQVGATGFQFIEKADWIQSFGIQYFMGVDGISLLLVMLTTLLGILVVLSSYTAITEQVKEYMVCLLFLQTGMIGVFFSLDIVLFYIFWEVMLIPMVLLIGVWGGQRRVYAAIKFFLYTLVGSLFMLIGFLAVYFTIGAQTGVYTFDLLKSALRQRPDYIIVGEVRGEEAYTLFQSIAVGHGGLCTIHADSIKSVIKRLLSRPMNVPEMMLPLMNVMIQIKRVKYKDQILRRVTNVAEVTGLPLARSSRSEEGVQVHDRFSWNADSDSFTDTPPTDLDMLLNEGEDIFNLISHMSHIPVEKLVEEQNRREVVLKWMVRNDLNSYEDVAQVIRNYYFNPEQVYNTARLGAKI